MLPTRRILYTDFKFLEEKKQTTVVSELQRQRRGRRKGEERGKVQKAKAHIQTRWVPIKHAREVQLLHLFFQAAGQARVHARAAGEHDVLVQVRAYVDCGVLDRFEEHLGDARLLDVDQVRLEHALGSLEALRTNFDRATVGQLNEMGKKMSSERRIGGLAPSCGSLTV